MQPFVHLHVRMVVCALPPTHVCALRAGLGHFVIKVRLHVKDRMCTNFCGTYIL